MTENNYASPRFDGQTEAAINVAVLETIPFGYPGRATEVTYETDEFTFVCPWTGLPDLARLVVRYLPKDSLVELKSLKYYLTSYRNVGILQEDVVNHILDDLVKLLSPTSMVCELHCRERGGIRTFVRAAYP